MCHWNIIYTKGFRHEHTRPDREDYIKFQNRTHNGCYVDNYEAHLFENVDTYGYNYDYCSVMHYSARSSSCIMTPKQNISCTVQGQTVTYMGQRLGMSETDIQEVNSRYDCVPGKNMLFTGLFL